MLIEKNVPLPPPAKGTNGGRIAGRSKTEKIARQLEVGDSIFVPIKGKIKPTASTTVRSRFAYHGDKLGHTYAVRRVDGGVRLWRTA
jgi:hypothetical protein